MQYFLVKAYLKADNMLQIYQKRKKENRNVLFLILNTNSVHIEPTCLVGSLAMMYYQEELMYKHNSYFFHSRIYRKIISTIQGTFSLILLRAYY